MSLLAKRAGLRCILIASLVSVPVAATAGAQEQPVPQSPVPPGQTQNQPEPRPLIQAGLGLMIGVPVGEFADNVDVAAGLSGHVDFGLGRTPVSIGAEATYLWYGSESRDVPLSGIPGLSVPVETSNDIFLLHGRVRAQKQQGRVRPYVDGLVGFSYLVTTTSVEGDESCSSVGSYYSCSDSGDSFTNLDDLTFSAGGGAGIMFAFGSSPHSIRLDVSVRYLYGGEAQYLTEDFFPSEEPVTFHLRRSRTDMLLVYVGLAFGR